MRKNFLIILTVILMVSTVNLVCAMLFVEVSYKTENTQMTENVLPEQELQVLINNKAITMPMSSYLTGVLISEMPADFHIEAKKAQAIAARTFALRMKKYSDKHSPCAVCDDPGCCQGYLSDDEYLAFGGTEEGILLAQKAVYDTAGLVLKYNNDLIEATYFSCSGGKTEDSVAVWGTEVPYLQSVDSPGEEDAAFYINSTRYTIDDFEKGLGVDLPGDPSSWFGDITYTDGGGINTMEIGGIIYSGNQLRKYLQLRSTRFTMLAMDDCVIITSRGFGHRVGMSQYGANAMANIGNDFRKILLHYYQGVKIESE